MKILISLIALLSMSCSFGLSLKSSDFNWTGSKKLLGAHTGKVFLKEHSLNEKNGKLNGAKFVMDLNTTTVTDLKGDSAKGLLDHLKGSDFLEVQKFPTATLNIKELKNGKAKGDLTIKGKTNPVSFDYKETNNTYEGKLVFDRTKYGIVYNSENSFKNLIAKKVIKDEVSIDFKVSLQ